MPTTHRKPAADRMASVHPAAVALAVLLIGSVAGCSRDAQTAPATSVPAIATSTPAATATTSSAPAAGLSTPATSAGPLHRRSLPRALDLGAGWKPYTDPGDPEEGYLGSGSWVRARGVSDVVAGIVPLGCRGLTSPPHLPVPEHALEATYRGPGAAPGVALVLDYRSPAAAASLLAGLTRIARSCPPPSGPVAADEPLTVVVRPERIDANTLLDRRRETGEGASEWQWSEAVVRRGTRVGLLIVGSDPGVAPPDLDDLAVRLRASILR